MNGGRKDEPTCRRRVDQKEALMKRTSISLLIACLAFLGMVAFMSGCSVATGSTKHVTSIVDYLYPDSNDPAVKPGIPVLALPLKVGIAFVPGEGGGNYGRGLPNLNLRPQNPPGNVFLLSEQKKIALMQTVADHFKTREFVKEIEIIPSTELNPRGSFAELDRIRTVHGLDVIGLLSYDQVQFTDEGLLSLTYWTLIGIYVVPGEKNDTHTMMDAAVYDIKSRKMLFRAPGTSHIKGSATPTNLSEELRADSDNGFTEAAKSMLSNLDEQLARFRAKVKENPAEYKIIK
jgi:rhombotail lipoprotein